MDFLCCIFNEYIIIYFFGLEHDTKDAIILRSSYFDTRITSFIFDDDEEEKNNGEEIIEEI